MKPTESGRQAIIVIHGIGNQHPMATLRDFVYNIFGENKKFWSSPNRITDDLELRRLSIAGKKTDLYEYYWAHLINDPTASEVFSWIFKILFLRKPSERLKVAIPILRYSAIFIVAIICILMFDFKDTIKKDLFETTILGFVFLLALKILLPIIRALLTNTFIQYVGDAVRYLTPTPQNIQSRSKIREGGIDLLRKLHESRAEDDETKPRYDRIVMIGHSLGAVIAYDILANLWSEYNAEHGQISDENLLKQSALEKIQDYVLEGKIKADNYQSLEENLLAEEIKLGNPWRVSDFVTLGCPLTHVSLLMTKNKEDFEKRKHQREFPTCPPVIDPQDKGFSYHKNYILPNNEKRTIKVLHHAAHFGMTKWTNMYFKNDFIGGKLKKEFGDGIEEVELRAKNWIDRVVPIGSHTLYWNKNETVSFNRIKQILGV